MESTQDNNIRTSAPFKICLASESSRLRASLKEAVATSGDLELVASSGDPLSVFEERILADVLILECGPSRIEAMILVRKLCDKLPVPVIVLAEGAVAGSTLAVELLDAGAIDVLPRPTHQAQQVRELVEKLVASVRLLPRCLRNRPPARVAAPAGKHPAGTPATRRPISSRGVSLHPSRGNVLPPVPSSGVRFNPRQLLLIGASTGGTEAIHDILARLPSDLPGICIVQHIPAKFSRSFADRLNARCSLEVREAVSGDVVSPGVALVAPGGYHMEVHWKKDRYVVNLTSSPAEHHQRPAVDVLFRTGAAAAGRYALGVLLTGMGRDGALGMQALKQAGAVNLAQHKDSCVVYGMPAAAQELNVVDQMVPLNDMPQAIVRRLASLRQPTAA